MKKFRLLDDLFLFCMDSRNDKPVANTYLLKGDKNILIDAGFLVPEHVEEVVLTHCHFDHSNKCAEYKQRGSKILISEEGGKHLATNDEIMQPDWAKEQHGPSKACKPDTLLKPGDHIKNSNWNLEVISTPGHTPGSITLYDKKRKIAFTGDTWYGGDVFGATRHPGGDKIELLKSLNKLKKLDIVFLCPGHGTVKQM